MDVAVRIELISLYYYYYYMNAMANGMPNTRRRITRFIVYYHYTFYIGNRCTVCPCTVKKKKKTTTKKGNIIIIIYCAVGLVVSRARK